MTYTSSSPTVPSVTDARALMTAVVAMYVARVFDLPDSVGHLVTSRDADIVQHRVLFCRTLEETAAIVGTTRENVRRSEIRTLRLLRAAWDRVAAPRDHGPVCEHPTFTYVEHSDTETCDACGYVCL